jgi:hypothetical protein
VRIGDGVWIDEEDVRNQGLLGKNQVSLEGIRFCWKKSGFVGRNQVMLEEIRF